ncbi:MAG: AAA family ATPase, partial [Lactobacillus iners]|nr:AAA family ATPase [Lactobacillus iners]
MIKKVIIKGYRKFKDFKFEPEGGMNIVVGDNESGKSTLFEAIIMALTGRIDGVRASEAINPYMFNKDNV